MKCELASTCKVHRSLWIIAWTWNKPRAPVLCGNDPLLSADHRSHARNITVGTIESTLRASYKLLCIAESTMQAAAVFIISVNVKRWFSYVFVACCPCCARLSVVGSLFSVLACLSLTGTGVYNVLKNNDSGLVCLLRSLPWLKFITRVDAFAIFGTIVYREQIRCYAEYIAKVWCRVTTTETSISDTQHGRVHIDFCSFVRYRNRNIEICFAL